MANIIPMAGVGRRYTEQGYLLPKPLISVSGIPMIIKVIRDMPPAKKWIFIVRDEYLSHYSIDKLLQDEISNPIIIPVSGMTEGQACTACLASPYISSDEPLFISACDNGYCYNPNQFQKLIKDPSNASIIWTFIGDQLVLNNPDAWGWVKISHDNITIDDISCKCRISESPLQDHAIIGSFYFSKASDFFLSVNMMIQENYRINNEFYIDCIPIFLKKMGKKSIIFDVDHYVGFGTPDALHMYERIEYLILHSQQGGEKFEDVENLQKWRNYFNKFHE